MRRENPGTGVGRPGRARAAGAADASPAELHGGTAVDEHPASPAAALEPQPAASGPQPPAFASQPADQPAQPRGSQESRGFTGHRAAGASHAGHPATAPPWRSVIGASTAPDLHRGVLTSGTADQLAALTARGAQAPGACIQFVERNKLRLYGSWGAAVDWEAIADTDLDGSLGGLVIRGSRAVIVNDATAEDRVPREALRYGVSYLGYPVHDRLGQVLGVCCAYDVHPRQWTPEQIAAVAEAAAVATLLIGEQLARHELEQQHRFLDAVLESLHDGVTACDADGQVVFANGRMRRLWEDDPHDIDEDGLGRALAGERLRDEPVTRPGPTKRTRHYLMDAQPILGPDGGVVGAVQALQDVTRQRRAERFRSCELAVTTALAEAPSMEAAGPRVLEAVVDTLDWVHAELWKVDAPAGVIRAAARWSLPGWATGIEVPEELAYGQGLAGRAWQVDKPLWIRDVGRPQSLISPRTAAERLHTALAIPVHDGTGAIGVLTVFADDIEDPEDELVALMSGIAAHLGQFVERGRVDDLRRQLVRSKAEYLALIGHEMRTPLTSISTYTGLLREADEATLVREGPRLIEVVERNALALRDIINELLELSALDAGHAEIRRTPMDLAGLVRDVVDRARAAIGAAPVVIDTDLPGELIVPGDRDRLRQIVENLLGSAIRYSPDGGHVGVSLHQAGRAVELAVSDAAADVPRDEREKLFTGRYRTSRGHDRTLPGSGLGLTLSRAVVERHHGSIELTGGDAGTTVLVRLPLEAR
ncbi:Signal transduction histidine kinase [Actinoplanes regularis]|uniref:Sensor-like histidine kinase SenX3 n=1 Tax=Actinoplanes regularis TaxID=52697 RepID=A0A239DHU5_9ACTN|nr:hypothetical protein Are01nite_53050 [Actinoplanes regularis]SNS31521.1 Signal transduction histidine kinase [Actinoplanes regularis]